MIDIVDKTLHTDIVVALDHATQFHNRLDVKKIAARYWATNPEYKDPEHTRLNVKKIAARCRTAN